MTFFYGQMKEPAFIIFFLFFWIKGMKELAVMHTQGRVKLWMYFSIC